MASPSSSARRVCVTCGNAYVADMKTLRSPVPHLFDTGEAPAAEEVSEIQRAIKKASRQLEKISSGINEVAPLLKFLLEKKKEVEEFYEKHNALLEPVRRLPNELLGEIMGHLLPGKTYRAFDANKSPMVVSQVSRYWRSVALSTPSLWSSISITGPVDPDAYSPTLQFSKQSLLNLWLERSRNTPLSLSLILPAVNDFSISLIEAVAAHSSRWRLVHLELRLPLTLHLLSIKNQLPLLRSLNMVCLADHEYSNNYQSLDMFESCPQLRVFHWNGPRMIPPISVPFDQLTHLRLNVTRVDDAITLLGEASTMRDCVINLRRQRHPGFMLNAVLTGGFEAFYPSPAVNHLHLQSLHFEVHSYNELTSAFQALTLPVLRNLSLTLVAVHAIVTSVWSQDDFKEFLNRSGCKLQTVMLTGLNITQQELEECFELMPTLTVLDLTSPPSSSLNGLLTRLKFSQLSPETALLPKLKTLMITEWDGFAIETFTEMLESRWNVPPKTVGWPRKSLLRRIHVVRFLFQEKPKQEILDRLGRLNDGKFDIRLAQLMAYDGPVVPQISLG